MNPRHGVNCFWQMPFRRQCRITLQNIHPTKRQKCYYQINYTLTDVPDDVAYFHAQFRRENPLTYGDAFTIVDGIRGQGHYVGTSMGWGVRDDLWFGEGEIKFFMRDRHRGLFRRRVGMGCPRLLRDIHNTISGNAAGHPT